MDAVVLWAVLAAALAVGELLSLDLVLAMLAAGALGGLGAAASGAGTPVQAVVAAVVAALMLALVRPVAKRHLAVRGLPNDPGAALLGREAVVVLVVGDDAGQVRVHGELWAARAALPGTSLPVGAAVWIGEVRGATVLVHPVRPLELP